MPTQTQTWTDSDIARAARHALRASNSTQVEIIDGRAAPELVGEGFRFETPGGEPVYYPGAYARAWGKPVYVPSTRRIVVGRQWRPTARPVYRAGDWFKTDLRVSGEGTLLSRLVCYRRGPVQRHQDQQVVVYV